MKRQRVRWLLAISLVLNIAVTVPAVVLVFASSGVQMVIYEQILAPRLAKPEIVFIGDSITQDGAVWAFRIGRYGFDTRNFAQAGLTTRQILRGQVPQAVASTAKFAFVMAGINDEDKSAQGADASFIYYREMLDLLRAAKIEPIVQLTLYRENEPTPEFVDRLNSRLSEYASEHGLSVIDLNASLARHRSLLPQYSRDGVHLTEAAYDIWAADVRRVLAMKITAPLP